MRDSMKTGAYISGAGHGLLFLWLLLGGFFVTRDDFDEVSVTDVSILSNDEFEAMRPSSPETSDEPVNPVAPEVDQPAPAPTQEEAPATPDAPEVVEEVEPEVAPEAVPEPEAPVEITESTPEQPEQPDGDPGDIVVAPEATPTPRQAEVIAPEAAPAPEPEVEIDDIEQAETAPDPEAQVVEEAQEETAPEETTTEIVTEADEPEPSAAPTKSLRPGRKPTPPAPQVAETPSVPSLQDSINDALTEANEPEAAADNANPGGGTGEPITRAEKGAFILAIQKCWNVGALSTDALKVTVSVGFTMSRDAKPEIASINMVAATGGSGDAVNRAYEAARRAIIRCGSKGFGLPADKYEQWRGVEVKFNATTKEIR